MSRPISIVCCVSALDCNCDDEIEIIQTTKVYQTVSDYLIGLAYFSIPLELLYFVSRSNIPFKWVRIQFVTFIVLCGLTHLLNAMAYHEQFRHSFLLVVSLTLAKLFKALVSCATAITLLTLIPLLLKWKLSEFFLKQNVLELDQEVGMMKKQKECSVYGLVMSVKQVEKGSGLSYMVKVSKGRQRNPEKSNVKKWVLILVGVVDGLIILLVFGGLAYYLIQKRRRNLLLAATNNTTCQIVELGV